MAARTQLSLRTELAQRLGFSASGSGAILQKALLNSALRSGQEQLFYEFGDVLTNKINDTVPGKTVENQTTYNVPADCHLRKPIVVSVKRSGEENYNAIPSGISAAEHNFESINTATPQRWDILEDGGVPKLELWPAPNTSTDDIRLEYNSGLKPFEDDVDLTSVEPQLILLHGITTMKAHYRQPDYEIYAGQLESLLGRIRAALTQRHRRVKRTSSFILDVSSAEQELSSSVTQKITNIIASSTTITPATGAGTYLVTATSTQRVTWRLKK